MSAAENPSLGGRSRFGGGVDLADLTELSAGHGIPDQRRADLDGQIDGLRPDEEVWSVTCSRCGRQWYGRAGASCPYCVESLTAGSVEHHFGPDRLRHAIKVDDRTRPDEPSDVDYEPEEGSESDPFAGINCVADVDPERIVWIWPGRLAAGKVHVGDGEPGLAKSLVMNADIAARFTTGAAMPGEMTARHEPSNVLILSNEDGVADTIRPRAEAAGADLRRLFHLEGIPHPTEPDRLLAPKLPTDHKLIEAAINRFRLRLLVIDPISSFIAEGLNQNADSHMRAVLDPLAKIAERTGCCIFVLRHTNKKAGASAIDRGSGAVGIGGAARVVLTFGWHPDDSEVEDKNDRRRAIGVAKVNVAKYAPTIAYSVVEKSVTFDTANGPETFGVPVVKWAGRITYSADDLVGAEGSEHAAEHDDAANFLRRVLADGPLPVEHIAKEAKDAGFSMDQLKRAKKRARVTSDKQPGLLNGKWFWTVQP